MPCKHTGLHVLAVLVYICTASLRKQHIIAEVVDLHLLKVEHLLAPVSTTDSANTLFIKICNLEGYG